MRCVVTKGVVDIRTVEYLLFRGSIFLYIETDQKYPIVLDSISFGPKLSDGRVTIIFQSKSGKGAFSYVECIPETAEERRLFKDCWLTKISNRYGAQYCIVKKPIPSEWRKMHEIYRYDKKTGG